MGRWRPRKRKAWPKTELHPGVNVSRGYIPSVGGSAEDDYSVESGDVRSLRKWRQLTLFALGALALFAVIAWFVWPHVSDLGELIGAIAILGKYFVLAAGPVVLLGVILYYYAGVGTEWPIRTASRLAMIGALLGAMVIAGILALGYLEGRADEYRTLWWLWAVLVLVAIAGYFGQRDR